MTKPNIPAPSDTAVELVESLAKKYALDVIRTKGHMQQAIMLAQGIAEMKAAIRPMMPTIMPLMNSQLGFDTDKNPSKGSANVTPYAPEVVEDNVVEAMLRGLQLVGNQFNIIAARCYTTRNGYKYLVERRLPGITDLMIAMSPPYTRNEATLVRCSARWKLNGLDMEMKDSEGKGGRSFAIRVNAGQGADAILGKAERRIYKTIWDTCTGCIFTEPNVDDEMATLPVPEDAQQKKSTVDQLTDKLAGQLAQEITAAQKAKIVNLSGLLPQLDMDTALTKIGKKSVADVKTYDDAEKFIAELEKALEAMK